MIYLSGTSRGRGATSGAAEIGGHFAYGAGSSLQQSELARSLAPPAAQSGCLPLILGFVAFWIAAALLSKGMHDQDLAVVAAMGVASLVTALLWYPRWEFNRNELPKQHEAWRRTFVCMRCGFRGVSTSR